MPVTTRPKPVPEKAPEKASGKTQNKGKSLKSSAATSSTSSTVGQKSSRSLAKAVGEKRKNISDGESGHESDKEMAPQMTKAQYMAFMEFQKNQKKKTSTQHRATQKALKAQQDLGQSFLTHLSRDVYC